MRSASTDLRTEEGGSTNSLGSAGRLNPGDALLVGLGNGGSSSYLLFVSIELVARLRSYSF